MATRTISTDVLVVGAGPTGLTAALSLANLNVEAITISRYPGPAPTPRAHITNKRTMEVFRDLGIEAEVRDVAYPLAWLHNNVFVTTLAGPEIARFKSYGASAERLSDYASAGPSAAVNCPQHVMEPVLLAAARERGADIRYSEELTAIEQNDEAVTARLRNRETGDETVVIAKYVVGADGARSYIAETLGFDFGGEAGLRGMVTCWMAVDLSEYVEHRPGVLYWPAVPGHFGESSGTGSWNNVRPWDEWMFVFPWEGEELPDESEILERAHRSIGTDDIDITIKARTKWFVNNVVATNYRKGRVFLAGDAAHRHPPYGGLGTNTSVQDAFNLAWKLAWVLRGDAGEELLESYSAERQPVGAQVVARAIQSWRNTNIFADAIGLKDGQTEDEGWAAINEIFEHSPEGVERRRQLSEALELQTYRANALGVELGQRYRSSAVISDGTDEPTPTRDPELYYEPTTRPGAYLPHAWIEHNRTPLSTLDVVGHGEFTLLVGVGGDAWAEAAAQLSDEFGIGLSVRQIALRGEYDDVANEWEAVRGIDDEGALLVRPDRHIAWRAQGASTAPADDLRNALVQIIGARHRVAS